MAEPCGAGGQPGWMRSQAIARVVPYRSVTCVVTASGWPQVSGLAKRNSLPCLGDRSLSGGESGRAHHLVRTHPSEDLPGSPCRRWARHGAS